MNYSPITAVGVDVSKSKSTVAIRRPGGEVVRLPFDVQHNTEDVQRLISMFHKVDGKIKIVIEHAHCTSFGEYRILCQRSVESVYPQKLQYLFFD